MMSSRPSAPHLRHGLSRTISGRIPLLPGRGGQAAACFGEMRVQREDVAQTPRTDELEADAIDQAEAPPILAQQALHAFPVQRLCDPDDRVRVELEEPGPSHETIELRDWFLGDDLDDPSATLDLNWDAGLEHANVA